jgi:cytochrome c
VNSIWMALVIGLFATSGARAAQRDLIGGRPETGAIVFKQCMACHQIGPSARNGIGPVLNGVVGRPAGVYPGYSYSSANKNSGLVWDEETLARYLRAPADLVPGTKMIFFGLKKTQDIADVIAYLKRFDADGKQTDQREGRVPQRVESQ